ncbi:hypothetical protein [Lysinibacillus piscis]|uniref:Lipoprotein n=1 Tax=Lysinibacillus piscis TaxID=2518931 RepID=A0ABQ5NJK3_9BACI|nr:hypothetical protein [Lysinibacillus sp. KH24]GLC88546.1 hypothetical protein LYSBPC_16730 [Lysinibacillus sp. KH24]
MGCSSNAISGKKPPSVQLEIGGKTYPTTLGTYCWKSGCVDTAGPIEILRDKETIKVQSGETVGIVMDYQPQPSKVYLEEVRENQETVEITVTANQFTAPTQQGIYYYSYGVWWLSDEDGHMSNGDAFYVFALEVQ